MAKFRTDMTWISGASPISPEKFVWGQYFPVLLLELDAVGPGPAVLESLRQSQLAWTSLISLTLVELFCFLLTEHLRVYLHLNETCFCEAQTF